MSVYLIFFCKKIDFLSGWLCYRFLWATVWYMWVLSNTNHFIQQSTVMPLTVDQYSADTCCVNWVLTSLVWHVVECRSTCWPISWSSCQVIVNWHILSRGVPKWQGYFAERWTLNAECWTTEVLWLGLGNGVNQVSDQFSQFNDPKWNLIHSVS